MKYITMLKVDPDIILEGNRCITSMQELYQIIVLPDTREIVLKKDFTMKYLTQSGLTEFMENVQMVNDKISIDVDEVVHLFEKDRVVELQDIDDEKMFWNAFHLKPKNILDTIQMLCSHYLSFHKENVLSNYKISALRLENARIQKEYDDLFIDYTAVQTKSNELESKLKTLVSRIRYNYNKDVDSNEMFQVTGSHYDKILYIKEVTRIHYVDTLLYYIQEILKIMYNMPCRFVVVESFHSHQKSRLYPRCVPSYSITNSDVFNSDIFMAGFQPKLMKSILNNPSHMSYLIVLDRCGYSVPHVYGKNIDLIYTASDISDISEDSNVSSTNIISYNDNTLHIPHIDGFSVMSLEERMHKYSSLEITQKLIQMLESR